MPRYLILFIAFISLSCQNKVDKVNGRLSSLDILISDPILVAVAEREESWGYFQFPSIYAVHDSLFVSQWQMADDKAESYGVAAIQYATSSDLGQTWTLGKDQPPSGGGIKLPNGDQIKIYTPKAEKLEDLDLPHPVELQETFGRKFAFYKIEDLPVQLQGVYFSRLRHDNDTWEIEHNTLNDSLALRYAERDLFPLVWWGDMTLTDEGDIIAGVYPGYHREENKNVQPSGTFFYKSTDNGKTWNIQGRIPFSPDLNADSLGNQRVYGFTEPTFTILNDGSYLCVMRSTDRLGNAPMYASHSKNEGKTWSVPTVIAETGVLPRLLQLSNGVIVLSSGRPGVQLRFSTSSEPYVWTDPYELVNTPRESQQLSDEYFGALNQESSCGYTGLLSVGPNSFIVIYSDFLHRNEQGEIRKAIKIREVEVN